MDVAWLLNYVALPLIAVLTGAVWRQNQSDSARITKRQDDMDAATERRTNETASALARSENVSRDRADALAAELYKYKLEAMMMFATVSYAKEIEQRVALSLERIEKQLATIDEHLRAPMLPRGRVEKT